MSSLSRQSLTANPPVFSFDEVTPASIRREANEIKQKFTSLIQNIKRHNPSFALLNHALGEASASSAHITLPSMVHGNSEVRAASNAMKDDIKTMFDTALSDNELYNALINRGRQGYDHDDDDDDVDWRFTQNILRIMGRNGCTTAFPTATVEQSTIQMKRKRIEEICTAFCAAINEHDGYLLFTEEELEGLGGNTNNDIDRYPIDETSGKRKIGLKAPSTLPILKFAKNSNTRKQVIEALANKCQEENTPRFLEVLKLRDECAKLLGNESHGQYMCNVKMVGTIQKAEEFLLNLVDAYEPKCKQELKVLLDLKKSDIIGDEDCGNDDDDDDDITLDPWDIAYYTTKHKMVHGVDEASLRQYFPLDHVKATILSIYEELLGLKYEHVVDAKVWHEDVECYAVKSAEDGELLGYFYLDIFPRPGKYSHQCVYPLRPSYTAGVLTMTSADGRYDHVTEDCKSRVLPACVNIGNLTPSQEGAPSLLLFREVETFFHEFGHAMHCCLTKSQHSLHSWTWSAAPWPGGVEQDFLEVPSMMLENFVWVPEILRRLSKNISDGSCLPESTIEALSRSRFLMTGYAKMKYLAMALYDLKVHSGPGPYEFEGREYDAVSLYNVMIEKYTGIPPIPGSFAAASWFHLLMGYDAGYYGYVYAEAYAADLFSKFDDVSREDGKSVIDAHLGKQYRDKILSPCATLDGEKMLINFLGREPLQDAFLSRIALS